MREQHVESDVAPPCLLFCFRGRGNELRNDSSDGCLENQQSALVEEHRHGRCGDNFRDRGQVEDGGRSHRSRLGLVGKVAEGFEGDELPAMSDSNRSAGEGALSDRVVKDGECRGKDVVLVLARKDQKRRRTWSSTIQSGETS